MGLDMVALHALRTKCHFLGRGAQGEWFSDWGLEVS